VREAVSALNRIRADYGIGKHIVVDAVIAAGPPSDSVFTDEAAAIGRLTGSRVRVVAATVPDEAAATAVLSDGSTVIVPLAGLIDLAQECERLRAELGPLENQLVKLRERLANPGFTNRAPAHVVEAERTREQEWSARADQLRARARAVCRG
jgi:valyl-tRNA synthetase